MKNLLVRFARPLTFAASAAGLVALATTASGCIIETHDDPPPAYAVYQGTAVFDWTIHMSKSPSACAQFVVDVIEITVYRSDGSVLGTYQQACESFATTITLDPGTYTASALLVDSANQARTTTLDLDPFTIYGSDRLTIPVEFPADSFY